ncbi:hypothetical protein [Roseiconus nitratireducens]|uniref:hypothetical protein n=1 Tax=Roseiconus nitratireducens TaxID=2605748 RepID=UPI00191C660B|nr:hypothetical protein [Roseiconus nitratireducens]
MNVKKSTVFSMVNWSSRLSAIYLRWKTVCATLLILFILIPMSEFLSAVEAAKLTTVSASTIKRFIRDVVAAEDHPSRHQIEPSPEELKRAQKAKEPYRWKIAKALVLEQFGSIDDAKKGSSTGEASELVLEILRNQLESKDEQIRKLEIQLDRKDDQIMRQDERMRETHVLMQDLQKRLALTPAPNDVVVIDDTSDVAKPNTSKEKRPLFGGLFRKAK